MQVVDVFIGDILVILGNYLNGLADFQSERHLVGNEGAPSPPKDSYPDLQIVLQPSSEGKQEVAGGEALVLSEGVLLERWG
jgi:hypothetical protein